MSLSFLHTFGWFCWFQNPHNLFIWAILHVMMLILKQIYSCANFSPTIKLLQILQLKLFNQFNNLKYYKKSSSPSSWDYPFVTRQFSSKFEKTEANVFCFGHNFFIGIAHHFRSILRHINAVGLRRRDCLCN